MATSSTTVITKKGDNLYKIGGKKMVTESRWRDVTLVHIREYDGEEPNVFFSHKEGTGIDTCRI